MFKLECKISKKDTDRIGFYGCKHLAMPLFTFSHSINLVAQEFLQDITNFIPAFESSNSLTIHNESELNWQHNLDNYTAKMLIEYGDDIYPHITPKAGPFSILFIQVTQNIDFNQGNFCRLPIIKDLCKIFNLHGYTVEAIIEETIISEAFRFSSNNAIDMPTNITYQQLENGGYKINQLFAEYLMHPIYKDMIYETTLFTKDQINQTYQDYNINYSQLLNKHIINSSSLKVYCNMGHDILLSDNNQQGVVTSKPINIAIAYTAAPNKLQHHYNVSAEKLINICQKMGGTNNQQILLNEITQNLQKYHANNEITDFLHFDHSITNNNYHYEL